MMDKYAAHYKVHGARNDVRLPKPLPPVDIVVPPFVLAKMQEAKRNGQRVVIHSV